MDDQINALILKELENYPFVSARRIRVAVSTMTNHLHKSLNMKKTYFLGGSVIF